MFRSLLHVFQVKELRHKILFTLGMLAVYRIGFWIPLPGVDQASMVEFFQTAVESESAAGRAAQYVAIFSGGSFSQSTIFGLGIMPYITAAIIFQLLSSVSPALKRVQEDGPSGRVKIQEWTRYATVGLCLVQGIGWLSYIKAQNLVMAQMAGSPVWWLTALAALTAGTVFLMWLGEQIDRYGIGNGVSLIITAGILTGMPSAILQLAQSFDKNGADGPNAMGMLMLAGGFVLVVGGCVLLTVAQRRIPIQQAKHTRGRRVFGGQRSYLPLRVNHSGVMPIIFASSLMIFPSVIFEAIASAAKNVGGWWTVPLVKMGDWFQMGQFPYIVFYIAMVFFFSFFWVTVQFNPDDMAKQLRNSGSFIPGLRPGPRTAEYLEAVIGRITYVGAGFLAIIAVLPMVVNTSLGISFAVTQFLGGTGLLIVVSVTLDLLQRIEANLLMRNYSGFLGGEDLKTTSRVRGSKG
ncbi:MAG: preprotein translocase subunit SecY [Planctomycetota bacterium]|nr:MAG: preprotein translocase subunit SecY [Planctomycetota bacterium]